MTADEPRCVCGQIVAAPHEACLALMPTDEERQRVRPRQDDAQQEADREQ